MGASDEAEPSDKVYVTDAFLVSLWQERRNSEGQKTACRHCQTRTNTLRFAPVVTFKVQSWLNNCKYCTVDLSVLQFDIVTSRIHGQKVREHEGRGFDS